MQGARDKEFLILNDVNINYNFLHMEQETIIVYPLSRNSNLILNIQHRSVHVTEILHWIYYKLH